MPQVASLEILIYSSRAQHQGLIAYLITYLIFAALSQKTLRLFNDYVDKERWPIFLFIFFFGNEGLLNLH